MKKNHLFLILTTLIVVLAARSCATVGNDSNSSSRNQPVPQPAWGPRLVPR